MQEHNTALFDDARNMAFCLTTHAPELLQSKHKGRSLLPLWYHPCRLLMRPHPLPGQVSPGPESVLCLGHRHVEPDQLVEHRLQRGSLCGAAHAELTQHGFFGGVGLSACCCELVVGWDDGAWLHVEQRPTCRGPEHHTLCCMINTRMIFLQLHTLTTRSASDWATARASRPPTSVTSPA